jgi:hypothetical protein
MSLVGSGWLSTGQSAQYDVILSAERVHRVRSPDRRGRLDLRIYDENENLIQWDESPASDAV